MRAAEHWTHNKARQRVAARTTWHSCARNKDFGHQACARQRVFYRDKFLAIASWALFEILFMNIVHRVSKILNLAQWDPEQ